MKYLIIGVAVAVLFCYVLVYNEDHRAAQRYNNELRFVAEEAAAAAAQYFNKEQYGLGKYQFNQAEGIKAAEYVIKKNLLLDNDFNPLPESYWTEKVSYTIEFFDHLNTTFPILYEHQASNYSLALGDPTVVVTLNAGKGRYRLLDTPDMIRTSAFTQKSR